MKSNSPFKIRGQFKTVCGVLNSMHSLVISSSDILSLKTR